jgi:hypothetical protein
VGVAVLVDPFMKKENCTVGPLFRFHTEPLPADDLSLALTNLGILAGNFALMFSLPNSFECSFGEVMAFSNPHDGSILSSGILADWLKGIYVNYLTNTI